MAVLGWGGKGAMVLPDFFASAIFVCTELYCLKLITIKLYISFIHTQLVLKYLTKFLKIIE